MPHDTRHCESHAGPGGSAAAARSALADNVLEISSKYVLACCCIWLHGMARRLADGAEGGDRQGSTCECWVTIMRVSQRGD
jgi:hypothetical protein